MLKQQWPIEESFIFSSSSQVKMSSNFNCSYMARSNLTNVRGFSVKFFFQPIYTNYANLAYFDKRSHLNLLL
jgi:hypothetical protein